jgi:hypothetical protein
VQQANDSQYVLDFLAFVEANATDYPVGDVGNAERFLNHTALGSGAVHNRDIVALEPTGGEQTAISDTMNCASWC